MKKRKSIKGLLISAQVAVVIILGILLALIGTYNMVKAVSQSKTEYQNMMNENYNQSIRNQTQAVISLLQGFYDRAQNGEMTDAEAQYEAKEAVRSIRYGDAADGYFWIDSEDFTLVMHPILPAQEGANREQLEDQNGNMIIQLIKNTCMTEGAGYNRFWFTKSDGVTVAEKISYSQYFEPWGWFISTGNYMDDIQAKINSNKTNMDALVTSSNIQMVIAIVVMLIVSFIMAWLISIRIVNPLNEIKELAGRISKGDFSKDIESKRNNEFGETIHYLNDGQLHLRELLKNTKDTTNRVDEIVTNFAAAFEQIKGSAKGVAKAMSDMSEGITVQAESTEQTSMTVNNMSTELQNSDSEITRLNQKSIEMKQVSNDAMKTLDKLEEINSSVKSGISQITEQTKVTNDSVQQIAGAAELIQNIAAQTNLLALNASIEAARAGEAGRGFAVVAGEIGSLSSQSTQAVSTIDSLISTLTQNSEKAVQIIDSISEVIEEQNQELSQTGSMFKQLYQNVDTSIQSIETVSDMSKSLETERQNITKLIETLSAMAQENASSTEETSQISESLQEVVEKLSNDLNNLTMAVTNLNENINHFTI